MPLSAAPLLLLCLCLLAGLLLCAGVLAVEGGVDAPTGAGDPDDGGAVDLDRGLVAHWPCRDGQGERLSDAGPHGRDGVIHGATWDVGPDGAAGGALRFDGKRAYVEIGPKVDLGGDGSVAFWTRVEASGEPNQRVLGKKPDWTDPEGYEVELSPSAGCFNFSGANTSMADQGALVLDYGRGWVETDGVKRLLPGEIDLRWHHVVAVIEGDVLTLSIDGKPVARRAGVAPPAPSETPLYLGAAPVPTPDAPDGADGAAFAPGEFFQGWLADLRLYDRALSAEEATALHRQIATHEGFSKQQARLEEAWRAATAKALHADRPTSEAEVAGMKTMLARFRETLLQGEEEDFDEAQLRGLLARQRDDGSWPDLDYADQSRAQWDPGRHVGRLKTLAVAWADPDSPLAGEAKALAAIGRGLRYYHGLAFPYEVNWWWPEIGVPMNVVAILTTVGHALPKEEVEVAVRLVGEPLRDGWPATFTGTNLVWRAGIDLVRGAFLGEVPRVRLAAAEMVDEILITTAEGVQPDGSFHQHGPQLYSHGYGASFSADLAQWAWVLGGTPWAFPPEKIAVVETNLLDGQQWMIRAGFRDPMTMGRNIARPGATSVRYRARNFPLIAMRMVELDTPRQAEHQALLDRLWNEPGAKPLTGTRVFWRSDYAIHRTPEAMLAIKAASTRVRTTESGNGENLLGANLNDGALLIVRHGDEYMDIFPLWDWERIPGTTSVHPTDLPDYVDIFGGHDFVGGVEPRKEDAGALHGCFTFTMNREGLRAKKSWFFLPEGVVCLGAGIDSTVPERMVRTTINQCFRKGAVTVQREGPLESFETGATTADNFAWLHHDGVGYLLPSAMTIELKAETASGRWHTINNAYSKDEVTGELVTATILHGVEVESGAYEYTVLPGLDAEATAQAAAAPPYRVLANTPKLQAVAAPDGSLAVVFHEAGTLPADGAAGTPAITVDKPSVLTYAPAAATGGQQRISVADPSQRHERLAVTVGEQPQSIELPKKQGLAGSTAHKAF